MTAPIQTTGWDQDVASAQNNVQTATINAQNAAQTLATATNNVQNISNQVNQATTTLNNARNRATQASTRATQAQQAVNTQIGVISQKRIALNAANASLNSANGKLSAARAMPSSPGGARPDPATDPQGASNWDSQAAQMQSARNEAINAAQQEVDRARTEVQRCQEELNKEQDALPPLQQELEEARQEQQDANTAVNEAATRLNELQGQLSQAQQNLTSIQQQVNSSNEAKAAAEAELRAAQEAARAAESAQRAAEQAELEAAQARAQEAQIKAQEEQQQAQNMQVVVDAEEEQVVATALLGGAEIGVSGTDLDNNPQTVDFDMADSDLANVNQADLNAAKAAQTNQATQVTNANAELTAANTLTANESIFDADVVPAAHDIEGATASMLWTDEVSQEDAGNLVGQINSFVSSDPEAQAMVDDLIANIDQYSYAEAMAIFERARGQDVGTVVIGNNGQFDTTGQPGATIDQTNATYNQLSKTGEMNYGAGEGQVINSQGGQVILGNQYVSMAPDTQLLDEHGNIGYAYQNTQTGQIIYIFNAREIVVNNANNQPALSTTYLIKTDGNVPYHDYSGGMIQMQQFDASGNTSREVTVTAASLAPSRADSENNPAINNPTFVDTWYGTNGQVLDTNVYQASSSMGGRDNAASSLIMSSTYDYEHRERNNVTQSAGFWTSYDTQNNVRVDELGNVYRKDGNNWLLVQPGRNPLVSQVHRLEQYSDLIISPDNFTPTTMYLLLQESEKVFGKPANGSDRMLIINAAQYMAGYQLTHSGTGSDSYKNIAAQYSLGQDGNIMVNGKDVFTPPADFNRQAALQALNLPANANYTNSQLMRMMTMAQMGIDPNANISNRDLMNRMISAEFGIAMSENIVKGTNDYAAGEMAEVYVDTDSHITVQNVNGTNYYVYTKPDGTTQQLEPVGQRERWEVVADQVGKRAVDEFWEQNRGIDPLWLQTMTNTQFMSIAMNEQVTVDPNRLKTVIQDSLFDPMAQKAYAEYQDMVNFFNGVPQQTFNGFHPAYRGLNVVLHGGESYRGWAERIGPVANDQYFNGIKQMLQGAGYQFVDGMVNLDNADATGVNADQFWNGYADIYGINPVTMQRKNGAMQLLKNAARQIPEIASTMATEGNMLRTVTDIMTAPASMIPGVGAFVPLIMAGTWLGTDVADAVGLLDAPRGALGITPIGYGDRRDLSQVDFLNPLVSLATIPLFGRLGRWTHGMASEIMESTGSALLAKGFQYTVGGGIPAVLVSSGMELAFGMGDGEFNVDVLGTFLLGSATAGATDAFATGFNKFVNWRNSLQVTLTIDGEQVTMSRGEAIRRGLLAQNQFRYDPKNLVGGPYPSDQQFVVQTQGDVPPMDQILPRYKAGMKLFGKPVSEAAYNAYRQNLYEVTVEMNRGNYARAYELMNGPAGLAALQGIGVEVNPSDIVKQRTGGVQYNLSGYNGDGNLPTYLRNEIYRINPEFNVRQNRPGLFGGPSGPYIIVPEGSAPSNLSPADRNYYDYNLAIGNFEERFHAFQKIVNSGYPAFNNVTQANTYQVLRNPPPKLSGVAGDTAARGEVDVLAYLLNSNVDVSSFFLNSHSGRTDFLRAYPQTP